MLVLLLGEIDLSVGAVSGLAASVMAVLSVKEGLAPELALVVGLLVGTAIGLFNGFMVTTFGIPSFVVTLAGLLGWQGAQLAVLGDTGSVNLPPSIITDLTSTFFDPAVGWALAAAAMGAYAASLFMRRRGRVAAGLEAEPVPVIVGRIVLVACGDRFRGRDPERHPRRASGGRHRRHPHGASSRSSRSGRDGADMCSRSAATRRRRGGRAFG